MAATIETVEDMVDYVRALMQDTVEIYRYENEEILREINNGLLEMRRLRPDLFLTNRAAVPQYDTIDSTEINIDQMYLVALAYYTAGKVQLRDDEDTQDSRAQGFINKFTAQMMVVPS